MSDPTATLDSQPTAAISARLSEIGPYQLLEVVGEGGMGAVYRALQEEPIRREVAIKVTRLDLTSVRRLARFQAERQTLARLNHPNIATVFDAGETPEGFPFMVMEYLDGESLLKYCDLHALSVRQRILLFIELCGALQYAHQQGVIHRDLKPSNVMVAEVDGQPVLKVIDFGIAKIADSDADHTREGALLGTPAYMSPEQIRSPHEVDSRTDVYSLGLILYELLTGTLPFERRTRDNWSTVPDHPLRSPSSRLRGIDRAELDTLVSRRNTAFEALLKQLKGDLDWVVLKAVREDPDDRYDSATELAADLDRYLDHFPVTARPPSRLHAARRFLQRHRWESAAGLLLMVGLASAVVVSTRAMLSAQVARAEAELEAQRSSAMTDFLVQTLRSADPRVGGKDVRVIDLLSQAADKTDEAFASQPLLQATMLETLGYTYAGLGQPADGEPLLTRALDLRRRELGPDHGDTLNAENQLLETQARYEPLDTLAPRFVDLHQRVSAALPPEHPLAMTMLNNMAYVHLALGSRDKDNLLLEQGVDYARQSLVVRERVLGKDAENTSHARNNLANGLHRLKRHAEAEALFRENLGIQKRIFGLSNHYTLVTMSNIGTSLQAQGQLNEAEMFHRQSLEGITALHGVEHPTWMTTALRLAGMLLEQSSGHQEAVGLVEQVIEAAGDRPEAKSQADEAKELLASVQP